MRTADAVFEERRRLVYLPDWMSTPTTPAVAPRFDPVYYAHASIKDKAFTAPHRLCFGDLFEVLEDTSFEMEDVLKALSEQV